MRTITTTEGQVTVIDDAFSDDEKRRLSDSLVLTSFRESDQLADSDNETPSLIAEYDADDFRASVWGARIASELQKRSSQETLTVEAVVCTTYGFGDLIDGYTKKVDRGSYLVVIFANDIWHSNDGGSLIIYSSGAPTHVIHPKRFRIAIIGQHVQYRRTMPSRISKQHLITIDVSIRAAAM